MTEGEIAVEKLREAVTRLRKALRTGHGVTLTRVDLELLVSGSGAMLVYYDKADKVTEEA